MSVAVRTQAKPRFLNVKSDFTGFGPDSDTSVLEADYPELFGRLRDDETAIVYWPHVREFTIPVLDGGGSGIVITYDPWTGRKLPESLRDRLCEELEAMGLDLFSDAKPAEFRSEQWWRERGL